VIDGYYQKVEVRFCNPAYQVKDSDKSSLVYVLDDEKERDIRLTSGSTGMKYTDTKRELNTESGDDEIAGIYYEAKPSS
jgi:hypothetical protein